MNLDDVDCRQLAHLPLIRAAIDDLGIYDVFDELFPKDPRSHVSDAQCAALILLNLLQGRVALYDMAGWLDLTDHEVLLGTDCHPQRFHDVRLGGSLDRFADHGTDDILSHVVHRYLQRPDRETEYCVHTDTTSVTVHGTYGDHAPPGFPTPARGFSKDHRPDLKQLIFGLSLHGAAAIPLTHTLLDGNTSDAHVNRLHIEQLAELLPEEDDVTFVADCKLVDAHTLWQLHFQGFHLISLVPRSFGVVDELVEEVRAQALELTELSRAPGATRTAPERVYRGRSFTRTLSIGHKGRPDPAFEDKTYRLLVVDSSELGARFGRALPNKQLRERQRMEKKSRQLQRQDFECEADARSAADKAGRTLKWHQASWEFNSEQVQLRRTRRGRPRRDETPPTKTVYRVRLAGLDVDEDRAAREAFHGRHFVLITDRLDEDAWPDERVLAEYRHQHMIEGHTGFRWLKGVADVAPVLLKTPRRITAMGLMFVLALMVRNHIQHCLRSGLQQTEQAISDRKGRPTSKPTTETAMKRLRHLRVLQVRRDGRVIRRQLKGLTEDVETIFRVMGVDKRIFEQPYEKWGGVVSRNP